jgi:hypothetical protein
MLKKFILNSKLLFFFICIFSLLNILDVITAMYILDGESNPIYLLTNSFMLLWLLKIVIILLCFYIYFRNKYPSKFYYFSFLYMIIIAILLLLFGVYSNIQGIINPQILETASQLSNEQKYSYYKTIILFFMIIPYTIAIMVFKLFEITNNKVKFKVKKK